MPNYIKLGNLRIEIPEPANNGGGGGGGGSSSLLTGLLAFYNLSDLTDASGNGNTLTNNGGVTFSAGKIGNAANFNGNGLISNLAFNVATAGSISLWVKSTPDNGWYQTFLGAYPGQAGLNFGITPDHNYFVNDFGSAPVLRFQNFTPNNTWVHLAFSATASELKLYLNGSLNNTGSNQLKNIPSFAIGAAYVNNSSLGENFTGSIDAVGLWNRALTSGEVTELYNAGTGKEHPFA